MAPFLRDDGPPVSDEAIRRARATLPAEYGAELVGATLIVRVPRDKPDYLHDLSDAAFYVSIETLRDVAHVLLVGHEKTTRVEPQSLRDCIRAQEREDAAVVEDLRKRLDREYGQTIVQSPSNFQHHALSIRIPKRSVVEFTPDDVKALRALLHAARARLDGCQYGYILADEDHERLGRRLLVELMEPPESPSPAAALPPEGETLMNEHAPAAQPETDEYEITSRPRATAQPAPTPAPSAPLAAPASEPAAQSPGAASSAPVADEYEIVSRAPRAPTAPPEARPTVMRPSAGPTDRAATPPTREFEIYSAPPRDPPAPTSAPATHVEPASHAPAQPRKTREYEIISRPAPAPQPPAVAPAMPRATPRDDPRAAFTRTAASFPAADNGASVVPRVAPAPPPVATRPEALLADRLRGAGYELVESVQARGVSFAYAAHKPDGRRILVQRAASFGAEQAVALAPLVVALGADVGVVVADRVLPGARVATWGTRLVVLAADEAADLEL